VQGARGGPHGHLRSVQVATGEIVSRAFWDNSYRFRGRLHLRLNECFFAVCSWFFLCRTGRLN
jgi:hypothetical protein